MKKLDIRSILIGVLCTALVFVLIGAKSQNENLGDIVVNSIKVLDDGTGGFLSTYNADGIQTSYLGTAPDGSGKLLTYNKHEVMVGYFGSNTDGDGIAVLYDRYGDIGWGVDGKQ